jgi:hypothetical protein
MEHAGDVMRTIRRRVLLLGCGVCIALCAATLMGCDRGRPGFVERTASIVQKPVSRAALPLPIRAQLGTAAEPDCEFKTTEPTTDDRQKLDYERQCYRHAAMIARERLRLLQSSVRSMARAADRCQWYAALANGVEAPAATGTLTD